MSNLRKKLAVLEEKETDIILDEDTIGVGQQLADNLKFVIQPMFIEGYANEDDINIQMRMTNGDYLEWSRIVSNGNVVENTLKINGQEIQLPNIRTNAYKEVVDAYARKIGFSI